MTKIKICGLTRAEDVQTCLRYGADILGFVVEYPQPVPWNLNIDTAKALIAGVKGKAGTCAVTGGSPEHIMRLAIELKPDYIQLHRNETPAAVQYLAGALGKTRIIKAVYPSTPLIVAKQFAAAGAHALLLDPRGPENAARGGAADYTLWRRLAGTVNCPVILAGGLNPENAAEALRLTNAPVIDVMTGVEASPGVKDERKIAALIRALRG